MPSTNPVNKAKDILESTLEAIDVEIANHERRLGELRAERKQVAASLAPLTKDANGPAKPAARKADVIEITKTILSETSPLPRETLKECVAAKLRETHSLAGFSLRFKEALETPAFIEDQAGVRLSTAGSLDRRPQ